MRARKVSRRSAMCCTAIAEQRDWLRRVPFNFSQSPVHVAHLSPMLTILQSKVIKNILRKDQQGTMIVNKILVLALAMFSLVAGSPGTVRNTRKLDKKGHLVPSKPPLSVKRMKGENGEPDELEIDVRVITCKKGSDECNKVKAAGGEVTKEEFVKKLADGMLGKLEEDDEKGHRNLDYWCDYVYWCDCCYCYLYYECYEW